MTLSNDNDDDMVVLVVNINAEDTNAVAADDWNNNNDDNINDIAKPSVVAILWEVSLMGSPIHATFGRFICATFGRLIPPIPLLYLLLIPPLCSQRHMHQPKETLLNFIDVAVSIVVVCIES